MTAYGYARISTSDQDAQLQTDALRGAGCEQIMTETASGARTDRPILAKLMADIQPSDSLTVWALDRLGRSTLHVLQLVQDLDARGVSLRSLREALDTSTPMGRCLIAIMASLGQLERERTLERIHAGIAAAKSRPGHKHGRPTKLTPAQLDEAVRQRAEGTPKKAIAANLRIARTTLNRALDGHDARHA